jgi:DNA primase
VIPQHFIQELLARADVVEVVGRYVQLKKGGINFMGLCPFHNEKSPSFTVSQTKQFYHCFGCGVHGSAIGFLMEHLGLSFVEAVKQLAGEMAMQVPDENREQTPEQKQAPGILQTLELASTFYRNRLKDSKRAIEYLKKRGLSGQTAKVFGLGYVPDGWRNLEAAFAEYNAEELVTSGLVIVKDALGNIQSPVPLQPMQNSRDDPGSNTRANERTPPNTTDNYGALVNEASNDVTGEMPIEPAQAKSVDGAKRYDRFRDRIMFPIRNPKGQVIGFGGRILDKGEPKYLNSPETPVFSKGRELYGLFEGRDTIRTENFVLVVEGYMDVVMLAEHGVRNAVATLGTATSPHHIQKLTRMVDRVVFSFDGDSAGRKAAKRALETCLPLVADDKRFDFLFLPTEHDPDSFVRENGKEAFESYIRQALPLSEFFVQMLKIDCDVDTPEGRALFQAEARPLLQLMPAATALRSQMMRRVAGVAQVDVADMDAYLAAKPLKVYGQSAERGVDSAYPSEFGSGYERDYGFESDSYGGQNESNGAGGYQEGGGWEQKKSWKKQGDWKGRGKYKDKDDIGGVRTVRRPMPTALIDRARLLAALFPQLVHDVLSEGEQRLALLPPDLVSWFDWLSDLAPGANFATVTEVLGQKDPVLSEKLAVDAQREFADLGATEAISEFQGALLQLRRKSVALQMNELATQGLRTEADKEQYQLLTRLERELSLNRKQASPP